MSTQSKIPYNYRPVAKIRLPRYLYHATRPNNLESIRDFGLVRGFSKGLDPENFPHLIWMDSQPVGLRKFLRVYYPGEWSIVQIRTEDLDPKKLYRHRFGKGIVQYVYSGDIQPKSIKVTNR